MMKSDTEHLKSNLENHTLEQLNQSCQRRQHSSPVATICKK